MPVTVEISGLKVPLDLLIGAIVDRYIQPLLTKVDHMLQVVTDLQSAVNTLSAQVAATTANQTVLKQKLDDAIAANATLQASFTTLQAQNADLSTQLQAAIANATDPAEVSLLQSLLATVTAQNQALADALARTSPSN